MAYKNIAISALRLDDRNPRLLTINADETVSLQDLAAHQGRKLLVLAQDIIAFGLNESELPIVLPDKKRSGKYVVLEGNRRLATLIILNDPAVLETSVPSGLFRSFVAASKRYKSGNPPKRLLCVVVNSRREARHSIILRHNGALDGAGISAWGPNEKSRFYGKPDPYRDLLEQLVSDEYVPADALRKVRPTNFKRIIDTARVRHYLGLKVSRGEITYERAWPSIAVMLRLVVDELYHGRVNVNSLRSKEDRFNYVSELLASKGMSANPTGDGVATNQAKTSRNSSATHADAESRQDQAETTEPAPPQRSQRQKPLAPRKTLIPSGSQRNIPEPRIASIQHELLTLPIDDFPNATGVMLRVFLELSVDYYIKNNSTLQIHENSKLYQKVGAVIAALARLGRLDVSQERAVRAATQSGTYLATSITTMNDFVHNLHMSPSPAELRSSWERLEPLFKALWPT